MVAFLRIICIKILTISWWNAFNVNTHDYSIKLDSRFCSYSRKKIKCKLFVLSKKTKCRVCLPQKTLSLSPWLYYSVRDGRWRARENNLFFLICGIRSAHPASKSTEAWPTWQKTLQNGQQSTHLMKSALSIEISKLKNVKTFFFLEMIRLLWFMFESVTL